MANKVFFQITLHHENQNKKLKRKVDEILMVLPKQRALFAHLKAFLFTGLYVALYVLSIFYTSNVFLYYLLYGGMGMVAVLVFLNQIHEAVHGTLFKRSWQNQLILYFFDLIGANSFIWKKRHRILHHRYQNIAGWDSDIEQASLLRIYPHDEKKPIHSIQHKLIFILYPLYLVNWVFVRDFKDYFKNSQLIRKVCKIPLSEYYKLFLFKFLFVFYLVVVPVLIGAPFVQAFFAMLFMIVVAGSFSLLTLLTPHVNTSNQFPLPDQDGRMKESWLIHQFATTNDVSVNNWFTRNVLGNFNFHIAHHLFPNISSVYAPEVTKVIRDYAEENGLGYRSYPIKRALLLHYQLIRNNTK